MKIQINNNFGSILIGAISIFSAALFADNSKQSVTVTAKTASYGGLYAPKNCVLIWIQKLDSTYIKTIYRGFEEKKYASYFKTWLKAKGTTAPDKLAELYDGMTGATLETHDDLITAKWDLTDKNKNPVSQGTYQFWIEMTENDSVGYSTFGTIEIDGKSKVVKGTTTNQFTMLQACTGDSCAIQGVKILKTNATNALPVIYNNKQISVELPSSGAYTVSLVSPTGKVVAKSSGIGKKALLSTNSQMIKCGIFIVKISQSGKTYILQHVLGL